MDTSGWMQQANAQWHDIICPQLSVHWIQSTEWAKIIVAGVRRYIYTSGEMALSLSRHERCQQHHRTDKRCLKPMVHAPYDCDAFRPLPAISDKINIDTALLQLTCQSRIETHKLHAATSTILHFPEALSIFPINMCRGNFHLKICSLAFEPTLYTKNDDEIYTAQLMSHDEICLLRAWWYAESTVCDHPSGQTYFASGLHLHYTHV